MGRFALCFNDQLDVRQLKTLLLNCFGGGIIGSAKMTSSTRTVPIVCANNFIVQALAQEEKRYVRTYISLSAVVYAYRPT